MEEVRKKMEKLILLKKTFLMAYAIFGLRTALKIAFDLFNFYFDLFIIC